ncbi:uncharacterized protein LOC101855663 [Aplysia californica]|uniref:Uncharacterized protein LOC101855663 n=1 Tax=Aplysia californica TaxID=6500 RepID=A0ABM0JY02_APLCA|nr:uncharacterized protein LOC101855663 [Aplysia californica]XP_005104204.1 uncharacterized protein LOC101855663 [Aplysia californica]
MDTSGNLTLDPSMKDLNGRQMVSSSTEILSDTSSKFCMEKKIDGGNVSFKAQSSNESNGSNVTTCPCPDSSRQGPSNSDCMESSSSRCTVNEEKGYIPLVTASKQHPNIPVSEIGLIATTRALEAQHGEVSEKTGICVTMCKKSAPSSLVKNSSDRPLSGVHKKPYQTVNQIFGQKFLRSAELYREQRKCRQAKGLEKQGSSQRNVINRTDPPKKGNLGKFISRKESLSQGKVSMGKSESRTGHQPSGVKQKPPSLPRGEDSSKAVGMHLSLSTQTRSREQSKEETCALRQTKTKPKSNRSEREETASGRKSVRTRKCQDEAEENLTQQGEKGSCSKERKLYVVQSEKSEKCSSEEATAKREEPRLHEKLVNVNTQPGEQILNNNDDNGEKQRQCRANKLTQKNFRPGKQRTYKELGMSSKRARHLKRLHKLNKERFYQRNCVQKLRSSSLPKTEKSESSSNAERTFRRKPLRSASRNSAVLTLKRKTAERAETTAAKVRKPTDQSKTHSNQDKEIHKKKYKMKYLSKMCTKYEMIEPVYRKFDSQITLDPSIELERDLDEFGTYSLYHSPPPAATGDEFFGDDHRHGGHSVRPKRGPLTKPGSPCNGQQPISLFYYKPCERNTCDLTHRCCRSRLTLKVDSSTQWEDPDELMKLAERNTFLRRRKQ